MNGKKMNQDEYEEKNTATIGQIISFLESHFKPDDRVCWMDCVEGLKNDCTYVKKEQLGTRFFRYVKSVKEKSHLEKDDFPYVKDDDVIIL